MPGRRAPFEVTAPLRLLSLSHAWVQLLLTTIDVLNATSYCVGTAFEVVFVYFMFPETSKRTLEELTFCKCPHEERLSSVVSCGVEVSYSVRGRSWTGGDQADRNRDTVRMSGNGDPRFCGGWFEGKYHPCRTCVIAPYYLLEVNPSTLSCY
ncbi:hypothetical protein BS17DRAFT_506220 [Gyrodon lividus]|nr:hypothetical protein BS17DRAFT_506220 [Gyrodon lividus]